ncbi:hypothetical protein SXCC_03191 [Gluconacetobacter sp. SXCC-1]|nr:hypothetical protein SXCC_03191 [Gluconacetobacter sp. SXCC-1]
MKKASPKTFFPFSGRFKGRVLERYTHSDMVQAIEKPVKISISITNCNSRHFNRHRNSP